MTNKEDVSNVEEHAPSIFERAALQSEMVISTLRAIIIALMVFRYVQLEGHQGETGQLRSLLVLPPAILVFLWSVEFIRRYRKDRVNRSWLIGATVIDPLVCLVALLGNVIFPGAAYNGLLIGPDITLLLVVTLVAGFRISVGLALLGGVCSLLVFTLLLILDHRLNSALGLYSGVDITLWLITLAAATGAACISAWRTHSLALQGARLTVQRNRARRNLEGLLHEHHDAQGILSSMSINLDRLIEASSGNPDVELIDKLRHDMEEIMDSMRKVQHSASGKLIMEMELKEIELGSAVQSFIRHYLTVFPRMEIGVHIDSVTPVALAGGGHGLARILMNLLRNAEQGNGRDGAGRLDISISTDRDSVFLSIVDDGPGLPDDQYYLMSNKPGGFGVGMESVKNIVTASGGRIVWETMDFRGTRVTITLPKPPG